MLRWQLPSHVLNSEGGVANKKSVAKSCYTFFIHQFEIDLMDNQQLLVIYFIPCFVRNRIISGRPFGNIHLI